MKTCPVCHTNVFDDMDQCYGCMHQFDLQSANLKDEDSVLSFKNSDDGLNKASDVSKQSDAYCSSDPLAKTLVMPRPRHGRHELPNDEIAVKKVILDEGKFPARDKGMNKRNDNRWILRLELSQDALPSRVWSAELVPEC